MGVNLNSVGEEEALIRPSGTFFHKWGKESLLNLCVNPYASYLPSPTSGRRCPKGG